MIYIGSECFSNEKNTSNRMSILGEDRVGSCNSREDTNWGAAAWRLLCVRSRKSFFAAVLLALPTIALEQGLLFAAPVGRPAEVRIERLPPSSGPLHPGKIGPDIFSPKTIRELRELEQRRREEAKADWKPFGQDHGDYSIFDGLKSREEREVLGKYLDADPLAVRLGIKSWRMTAPPKLTEIHRVLELARKPLQGHVELGLFLDDAVFGEAAQGIRTAWGLRPISATPKPELLEEALKARTGQTWIVVGHVEGDSFVMLDALKRKTRISIPDLLTKGFNHGVLVIPIGCRTAAANAPLGFIKPISTDAVATFLSQLPPTPIVADLVFGLRNIGQMRVKMDDLLHQLEIEVEEGGGGQVTHVRIPYNWSGGQPSGSLVTSSQFQDLIESEASALLPWKQRWWLAIKSNPLTYLALWLLFWFVTWTYRKKILASSSKRADSFLVMLLSLPNKLSQAGCIVAATIAILALFSAVPPLFFIVIGGFALYGLAEKFERKS
ncbi:hypothetical protein E3C22_18325 [Jiella endophytica]|uniref:Uncharacterized protein n=1 Tax=Jiella endophytica TaxID=2558362 RepID=A0A4Y8RFJ0_9HYPH|nr:hypothetical protein [Jiella endophytica]TFF20844.1 hypothetical protein E3C22_18325 [Jiella endophytica]